MQQLPALWHLASKDEVSMSVPPWLLHGVCFKNIESSAMVSSACLTLTD